MSKSNRVLDLYQALQNGQVINKKEAAEQFCVNEKSIQRDLDSIRDFLSEQTTSQGLIQSVEFDRAANGYRLVTEEVTTSARVKCWPSAKFCWKAERLTRQN